MAQTKFFGDLHTHTAHSREADNFLKIRLNNIAEAKKKMPNLKIVGIVDHDTANHFEPLYRAQKEVSLEDVILLPGIEVSTSIKQPNTNNLIGTHILGYFPQLIKKDEDVLRYVNSVIEKPFTKILNEKLNKNFDIKLNLFFKNELVPKGIAFDYLKSKILDKYEADKAYVESQDPKKGDIINLPLNSSDKMVVDVLLEEGILMNEKEGKLYADRVSDNKIEQLANILSEKENISQPEAYKKSQRLQGSCHGSPNDGYYTMPTKEAIALLRKAGGIPVFAHPMTSMKKFKGTTNDFFKYVAKELIPAGLQGMSAFYPGQEHLTNDIISFCEKNNLYITGGSDDHMDGRSQVGKEGSRCPMKYVDTMINNYK